MPGGQGEQLCAGEDAAVVKLDAGDGGVETAAVAIGVAATATGGDLRPGVKGDGVAVAVADLEQRCAVLAGGVAQHDVTGSDAGAEADHAGVGAIGLIDALADQVFAVAAVEDIGVLAEAAVEVVLVEAADERVGIEPAIEPVCARPAGERVPAGQAAQNIIAAEAPDAVGGAGAGEGRADRVDAVVDAVVVAFGAVDVKTLGEDVVIGHPLPIVKLDVVKHRLALWIV